ncbi:uncharacterized protein LOC111717247 [Eurytemora carolleeae]|uniref:uncharacterized protein LOC111717247 n=1 Tax=Eurytemora carolleeae TaxID=1294199 RepID=UPI000C766F90|nr:uncharacterized protein LOC111717247 [Eurytemora carolleeae]|eukprot:XP_023348528.1 uncharacterized protein LOC111717247 [Eurytemora affinis]
MIYLLITLLLINIHCYQSKLYLIQTKTGADSILKKESNTKHLSFQVEDPDTEYSRVDIIGNPTLNGQNKLNGKTGEIGETGKIGEKGEDYCFSPSLCFGFGKK